MNKSNKPIETFLTNANLDLSGVEKLVNLLVAQGAQFGDLYYAHQMGESFGLDNGVVNELSYGEDSGVGFRTFKGDESGFATSQNLSFNALEQSARFAAQLNTSLVSSPLKPKHFHKSSHNSLYTQSPILSQMADEAKIAILKKLHTIIKDLEPKVSQVNLNLSGSDESVVIANSESLLVGDCRPLVRLNVSVVLKDGDQLESGSSGSGGRVGYDFFNDEELTRLAKIAIRQAQTNLKARPAPAGQMSVVLSAGWPGVLLHEAVGHGLEGDFNRLGNSVFSGKIGQKVASDLCTVVDNGTLENLRGSLSIDDEGFPCQENVLIEKGILKKYLQDKQNATLMGVEQTGNGRRQSYAHTPMPRMTNTYLKQGKSTPESILKGLDKGIYAVNFSGGQVDITSGEFVFSASEAYWVEKGEIQYPVKGMTLIGQGLDVIQKITEVGDDLQLDDGIGTCGKNGQSVPVGVGMPTVRVESLTVGGTQA